MTNRSEAARRNLAADIEAFTCGEVPSPLDMMRAAKLENWVTSVRRRGNEFVCVVVGDVCTHAVFGDGENIQTSAVAWFDRDRFIWMPNRIYALGEPAPTRKE